MKLWVVPRMGARTNIEIVRRFQEYSDVFHMMTTGTAIEQLRYYQKMGWFTQSECFFTLAFYDD